MRKFRSRYRDIAPADTYICLCVCSSALLRVVCVHVFASRLALAPRVSTDNQRILCNAFLVLKRLRTACSAFGTDFVTAISASICTPLSLLLLSPFTLSTRFLPIFITTQFCYLITFVSLHTLSVSIFYDYYLLLSFVRILYVCI